MTTTLAHRQRIPVLIAVPDDPDALRLIRLIVLLLDFLWQHRLTVLAAADSIGLVVEAVRQTYLMVMYEFAVMRNPFPVGCG